MWIRLTILLVINFVLQTETVKNKGCYKLKAEDVCQSTKERIPHIRSRSPDMVITKELHKWCFCDVFAIDTGQWYLSKRKMTENCPEMYMCGTKFPIWLNGRNPNHGEGLVNRTACLKVYDEYCLREYSVVAVNCGNMMAYCFNELPSGCYQRYCFGESKKTRLTDTNPYTVRDRMRKHWKSAAQYNCPVIKNS